MRAVGVGASGRGAGGPGGSVGDVSGEARRAGSGVVARGADRPGRAVEDRDQAGHHQQDHGADTQARVATFLDSRKAK